MRYLDGLRVRLRQSWWGKILAEHDTEPTELSGGCLKVLLGLTLLSPLQTFTASPAFATLSVFPEWVWGSGLVVLGVVHVVALWAGQRYWRARAATAGFVTWGVIGFTFWHANPASIGAVPFIVASAQQLWCSIRLGSRA